MVRRIAVMHPRSDAQSRTWKEFASPTMSRSA
jgi:hypothetical protein